MINKVPRTKKYHPKRTPRRPEWDDPNVIWPPYIPPPTKTKGIGLINEIEQEEKKKLEIMKTFDYPDFRSGDVVKY